MASSWCRLDDNIFRLLQLISITDAFIINSNSGSIICIRLLKPLSEKRLRDHFPMVSLRRRLNSFTAFYVYDREKKDEDRRWKKKCQKPHLAQALGATVTMSQMPWIDSCIRDKLFLRVPSGKCPGTSTFVFLFRLKGSRKLLKLIYT